MKKLLSFVLLFAILGIGVAFATGIPDATSPKNYPTVWTEEVYNGSGTDIATQSVVQWDFDTSDSSINVYDDMCPWVKTSDDTDSVWIAGVTLVQLGIANQAMGQVIIKGPAVVDDGDGSSVCTAGEIVGAITGGYAADVSQAGTDDGYLGICIKATADNQGNTLDALIYINPTLSYDD